MKQLFVLGMIILGAFASVPTCTSRGYWGVRDGVHDYMYYECNAPFNEGWNNCPLNQPCTVGFFNEIPCGSQNFCGNGRIDAGEECDGGAGCLNCKCMAGYQYNNPATVHCVPSGGSSNPSCGTSNGFWCVLDGVHNNMTYVCNFPFNEGFQACPAGHTCRASGFFTENPCIPRAAVCGNGLIEFGEECDGGRGCNSRCMCRRGYEPTNPMSVNCQCEPSDSCEDLDYVCGFHDDGCKNVSCGVCGTGFKCENHKCVVDNCGNGFLDFGEECDGGIGCCNCKCVKGSKQTSPPSINCTIEQDCTCTPNATCASANANCGIMFNGCDYINCGTCSLGQSCLSNVCTLALCGNGIINGEEQCDGGLGCTPTCVCGSGYIPTVPRSISCGAEACVPTITCGAIECGDIFDGCNDISCGVCPTDSFCEDGLCVASITCDTFGIQCGSFFNGTTTLDCGTCPTGSTCDETGQCVVTPVTCESVGILCGSLFNGAEVVSCGTCADPEVCVLGLCITNVL